MRMIEMVSPSLYSYLLWSIWIREHSVPWTRSYLSCDPPPLLPEIVLAVCALLTIRNAASSSLLSLACEHSWRGTCNSIGGRIVRLLERVPENSGWRQNWDVRPLAWLCSILPLIGLFSDHLRSWWLSLHHDSLFTLDIHIWVQLAINLGVIRRALLSMACPFVCWYWRLRFVCIWCMLPPQRGRMSSVDLKIIGR
jgi:hypothetical protein